MRVVLGLETTGLGETAEIVEIAILDAGTGETLYSTLVMPQERISAEASNRHGFTQTRLREMGAHNWPVHHDAICRLLRDAEQALAYNAKLHRRILRQTAGLYNLELPATNWRCVMLGWSASLTCRCTSAGGRSSVRASSQASAYLMNTVLSPTRA